MKFGWAFWSAVFMSMQIGISGSTLADERTVTGGVLAGMETADGGQLFRGIPYAAPPLGALRWQAPQPIKPWQGVRDATKAGPPCLQTNYDWNAADANSGNEDCLYLDVHVPKHAAGEKLPVMFWIHGGANRAGSGIGYATSSIVEHGVILVTLQYRLGVFGFLSHPALTAEARHGAVGNFAILDQIAALRWVKANIAAFDGDPNNVTIFGQSAGAQDVSLLMLSPLARGLFHKAIEQSGTAGFGLPPRTLAENEKMGLDLAAHLHAPQGAKGLAALRAVPAARLLAAAEKLTPPIEDAGFIWDQATIDGYVVPRAPSVLFDEGRQAPVPLIVGNNARELTLYGGPGNVRHIVKAMFEDKTDEALKLYGLEGDKDPPDDPITGSIATRVANDVMFRCPASYVADRQTALGFPVWRYQFDVAKLGSPDPVWHSSELSFVFDRKPEGADFGKWPPVQIYWTNFAKTGNPNGAGLPTWPAYGSQRAYLEFTAAGPKPGQDLEGALCRLYQKP